MSQLASNTDGGITTELALHRPGTRREWITWYATNRAARVRLATEPDAGQLIEAYGLDADTIAATVTRWGGPALPDLLFLQWFGPRSRPRSRP